MEKNMSIAFTGDIGFDKYMEGRFEDDTLLDKEILDFFKSADHVVANVEGAMIDVNDFHGSSDKGMFFHAMNPGACKFLNRIGADYWNICNNHSMDAGLEGLESTMAFAKKNNAITFGAGKDVNHAAQPVFFDEAGGIGMLAVGYQNDCVPAGENKPGNFSWYYFDKIEETIKEIKSKCRWCVLVVHGGEEFCNMPLPPIRKHLLRFMDMGADVIIGHHPHVVQPYEVLKDGRVIFYSLGNFVFDTDYQRAQFNTDRGVLVKLNFSEDSMSYDICCTKLERTSGHISKAEPPAIFAEVNETEYEKLIPVSAKAKLESEKKRQLHMHPDKFAGWTAEQWDNFFETYIHDDYFKEDYMDFKYMKSVAKKMDTGEYKTGIPSIVEYIEKQI